MDSIEYKVRRLSLNQLKALFVLLNSASFLVSSTASGKKIGVTGKSLGGVFSSLSRQRINGQPLLIPFGRGEDGRGLIWKLNTKAVSGGKLKEMVKEVLKVRKSK